MATQLFKGCTLFPLLLAAVALPVFGGQVTYSTDGYFCTSGTCTSSDPSSAIFGTSGDEVTVSANGYSDTATTFLGTAEVDAITLNISAPSTATTAVTASGDFTLVISQSAPPASPPSGSLTAMLNGQFSYDGSDAYLSFASQTVDLGGVIYTVDDSKYTLPITTGGGSQTISMQINDSAVTPEPSLMALTGFGLAGLGFVAYRRRRTV